LHPVEYVTASWQVFIALLFGFKYLPYIMHLTAISFQFKLYIQGGPKKLAPFFTVSSSTDFQNSFTVESGENLK